MSEHTLQSKLNSYIKNKQMKDKQLFRYTISYFIMTRDNNKYSRLSEMFEDDIRTLLLHDIKHFIKTSFLTYSIQKGIYYAIKNNVNWSKAAFKFKLNINDLLYCWDILDSETKDNLIIQADKINTDIPTEEFLYSILKKIEPYCINVVRKYLRFISDYDTAYSLEDFTQDVLAHALVTIRRYDDFKKEDGEYDIDKIINYTKSAVFRYVVNIIKSNTNSLRSRIKNVSLSCGHCAPCLKGDTINCIYAIPQYQPTVLSLDYVLNPSTNRDMTFHEILTDNYDVDILKDDIKQGLPEKLSRFIDIVVYNYTDEEFDIWLKTHHNLIIDDILPNYKILAKYVMEFLQLNIKHVVNVLTSKCNNWSRKATAHCVSCMFFMECKEKINIRKNSKVCNLYKM